MWIENVLELDWREHLDPKKEEINRRLEKTLHSHDDQNIMYEMGPARSTQTNMKQGVKL
jgi:hypothetical protein